MTRKSIDRTVDRTAQPEVSREDALEALAWQNEEIARLNNRDIRQRITIIELARILGVEYGK